MNLKTINSIAGLYTAFKNEPKPHYVDGCPCCIDKKEIGVLLTKPISELSAEEMSSYTSSLFLTVGEEKDFVYFLPRIFEISASDLGHWPDPEISIGKLSFVEWKNWDKEKASAIQMYLEAVFEEFILSGNSDADTWLCAIARSKYDFTPFLRRLEKSTSGLIAVYESNCKSLIKRRLSNPFWDEVPEAKEMVISWFQSKRISDLIAKTYAEIYKN